MKRTLRTYQEKLLEDLQDTELAQLYLNEALEDEDPRIFLLALKNIYEAQGIPMTDLAKTTNLSRENIYRILSKKGNPKLSSIIALLNAVGFSLAVQLTKKR
jgi:probable addiction module antidote protein